MCSATESEEAVGGDVYLQGIARLRDSVASDEERAALSLILVRLTCSMADFRPTPAEWRGDGSRTSGTKDAIGVMMVQAAILAGEDSLARSIPESMQANNGALDGWLALALSTCSPSDAHCLRAYAERAPRLKRAYVLGRLYEALGLEQDWEDALRSLLAAEELDQEHPDAVRRVRTVLIRAALTTAGNANRAEAEWRKLDPESDESCLARAWIISAKSDVAAFEEWVIGAWHFRSLDTLKAVMQMAYACNRVSEARAMAGRMSRPAQACLAWSMLAQTRLSLSSRDLRHAFRVLSTLEASREDDSARLECARACIAHQDLDLASCCVSLIQNERLRGIGYAALYEGWKGTRRVFLASEQDSPA